jgi:hypothetical protein
MYSKFAKIVKRLSSESEKKRIEAMGEISSLTFREIDIGHAEYLIQSSTLVFIDNEDRLKDGSSVILQFVSKYESEELIPLLEDHFEGMSIWARSITLTMLARLQTKKSLKSLLYLIDTYIDEVKIIDFEIPYFVADKEAANVLLPTLFDYIEYPNVTYTINRYIWSCLSHGTIKAEDIEPVLTTIIREYGTLKKELDKHQDNLKTDILWSSEYQDLRNQASLYLDILGYTKSQEALAVLTDGLNYKDNRLVFFSTVSLLRSGIEVEQRLIDLLAGDLEIRNFLYKFLSDFGMENRFPEEFCDQRSFAEANMFAWLIHPFGLGSPPSELECMDVIKRYHEEFGEVEYYVYRFKKNTCANDADKWFAGISGYYVVNEKISLIGHGYTFSLYEDWDSRTAIEHFYEITARLDNAK